MDVSAFRTVAIGHVAMNKPLTGDIIEVTPTEWMTMRDGEMTSSPTPMEFKTKDSAGVETQGGIITDNTLTATWLPSGSNRISAPHVRRGEKVEILQTADAEQYYWRTMGLDQHLRKLETVIFGISASADESVDAVDPNTMYWIEFSSHTKKIALRTCKANGEPFLYEMFFDLDIGTFTVKDDVGNFVFLNSALNLIHLQTAMGTFVKLDQKDINAFAPQDFIANATRNVAINAGQNCDISAGIQATLSGGGSKMTLNSGSTTLQTPAFIGQS